jgi:hypothetical protein
MLRLQNNGLTLLSRYVIDVAASEHSELSFLNNHKNQTSRG